MEGTVNLNVMRERNYLEMMGLVLVLGNKFINGSPSCCNCPGYKQKACLLCI